VAGLIARCSSCLKMIEFYTRDPLLQAMYSGRAIIQSVLSRLKKPGLFFLFGEKKGLFVWRLQIFIFQSMKKDMDKVGVKSRFLNLSSVSVLMCKFTLF
jgi:hypothetical protein